jgi:hypothetical protein
MYQVLKSECSEDMCELNELDKVGSYVFNENFNEQGRQNDSFKKDVPEFYISKSGGASRNVLI